jgi:hypothetical protein
MGKSKLIQLGQEEVECSNRIKICREKEKSLLD